MSFDLAEAGSKDIDNDVWALRAVAVALDVIAKWERGTNHDAFVNAVLSEVAAQTRVGDSARTI